MGGRVQAPPAPLAEDGRGLLLVEALADRWEALGRFPVGKTVVAELVPMSTPLLSSRL